MGSTPARYHELDMRCQLVSPWMQMRWRAFRKFLDRDDELDERDALYLCRMLRRLGIASGIEDLG